MQQRFGVNRFNASSLSIFFSEKAMFRVPSALALVALAAVPSQGLGLDLCIFHRMFGIICPFCGLTRSISSILHLDWHQSLLYHPLGGLFLVFLVMCLITNNPGWWTIYPYGLKNAGSRIVAKVFLAVLVLGVWIYRL